jgi:competence protein ComEC
MGGWLVFGALFCYADFEKKKEMINRKLYYGILAGLLALALILGGIIYFNNHSKELKIIFLDVGQGDAVLISQGSKQILIDGGRDGKLLLEKLGKYIPFWDREIEVVVATHPDQDHIGGLISVLRSYRIDAVIKTNDQSESQTFKTFSDEVNKTQIIEAKKGVAIKLSDEAEAEVVYPITSIENSNAENSNDNSVIVKLNFGENRFLFMSDLPSAKENEIGKNSDLRADILKVSHHGSKYATGDEFLTAVAPQKAVISVGKNNMYGHPNQEVLDRLKNHNVEVLRTDKRGDIIFSCLVPRTKCQVN